MVRHRANRTIAVAFAVGLILSPVAGQAGDEARAPGSAAPEAPSAAPPPAFSSGGARLYLVHHPELFRPLHVIDFRFDRAVRLALWNGPMGRLLYAMAAEESMLGRTGLVNGGRALGAGLALTALGAGVSPIAPYLKVVVPPPPARQTDAGEEAGNHLTGAPGQPRGEKPRAAGNRAKPQEEAAAPRPVPGGLPPNDPGKRPPQ